MSVSIGHGAGDGVWGVGVRLEMITVMATVVVAVRALVLLSQTQRCGRIKLFPSAAVASNRVADIYQINT